MASWPFASAASHRGLQRRGLTLGPPQVFDNGTTSRHRSSTAARSTAPGHDDGLVEARADRMPQRPRSRAAALESPPAACAASPWKRLPESRRQDHRGGRHPGSAPDQSTSCTTCGRERPFSATSRPGLKQNSPAALGELLEQRRDEDLPAARFGRDARGQDDGTSEEVVGLSDRLARVQAHAHAERHVGAIVRPTVERALHARPRSSAPGGRWRRRS